VWFVWSGERVNRSNSYSRPTTKINSHSASFFRLYLAGGETDLAIGGVQCARVMGQ